MFKRVLVLCSALAFAGATVANDAQNEVHMIERADAWFEKFQAASPEKQAKMLARRNACLKLPEAERKASCGRGKGHQDSSANSD